MTEIMPRDEIEALRYKPIEGYPIAYERLVRVDKLNALCDAGLAAHEFKAERDRLQAFINTAVEPLNALWDDATNAVCQSLLDANACCCEPGHCIAAKVNPGPAALRAAIAALRDQRDNQSSIPTGIQRRDKRIAELEADCRRQRTMLTTGLETIARLQAKVKELTRERDEWRATTATCHEKGMETHQALCAAEAKVAELTRECSRLREALESIRDFRSSGDATDQLAARAIFANRAARAALNGWEPPSPNGPFDKSVEPFCPPSPAAESEPAKQWDAETFEAAKEACAQEADAYEGDIQGVWAVAYAIRALTLADLPAREAK